jgi:hypothetical protein
MSKTPKTKKKNAAAQSLTAMRNKKLTPERRKEIAQKAARKRWAAVSISSEAQTGTLSK